MRQLCLLVADVLGVEHDVVRPETGPLSLSRWDSLNHMRIVAAVEETYGVQLSTDEIVNTLSVKDIVALLQEKGIEP
ncbi:MAG: acyl carrier protein [Candidatus Binatia bacterium]